MKRCGIWNNLLLSSCFFLATPIFASSLWNNYFRFNNNFNVPMTLTIAPTLATVTNSCGGNIANVDVAPHSLSCEFEFSTEFDHWYSVSPENNGTITVTLKNDPKSYCTYHYSYTYTLIPYSYFDLHSENITLQNCQGNLKPYEISVVNDHNQALPKPLDGDILINLDKNKAAQSTESLSQADCGGNGGDNCLIASPDLNTVYVANGSTLSQSIALQNKLDRYEPLNFEQFLGSHNAAISRHYTNSTNDYDVSYSDPDNYMTLTDQLNSGVRQIELDIEWYNNVITICHNHVSPVLQGILCDGNNPLSAALTEIKSWIAKNPNEFIFIYLDVNLPLTGHVADLDATLATLDPYVFTPNMAMQYFKTTNNTLPAYELTQDSLINTFHKNIIITNDDDIDNLQSSQYAFVHILNSSSTPLTENSVNSMLTSSCSDSNKYNNIKNRYADDPNHFNLYRINADRTVIDYIGSVGDLGPDQYINYFTPQNLTRFLQCPVNVFSTNMLGYTCDTNNCNAHPTDPKLYAFLWSWNLGYPLQSGSSVAYINPNDGHFENDTLMPNAVYSILCYHPSSLTGPTAPLQWYLENIKISGISDIANQAQLACSNTNGIFAAPTTSYWLHDVMLTINANGKTNPYNVLVNYQDIDGQWIPNYVKMKNGNSLVR